MTWPYIQDSEVPLVAGPSSAAVGSPSVHIAEGAVEGTAVGCTAEDTEYCTGVAVEDTEDTERTVVKAAYSRFAAWVLRNFVLMNYRIQRKSSHQDYSAARNLCREQSLMLLGQKVKPVLACSGRNSYKRPSLQVLLCGRRYRDV